MIATYVEIVHSILTHVPAVRMIDIDQGQLEDGENFEPLLPPTVLIGGLDLAVNQRAQAIEQYTQEMQGMVITKTVITLTNDTHVTKLADLDRFVKKLEALQIGKEVQKALEILPNVVRTHYKEYHANIKKGTSYYVIEQHFSIECEDDEPDMGRYLESPQDYSVKINPFLYHGNP
jgi:hypothetical protein